MSMTDFKLVSLNVRGLCSLNKRKAILMWLVKQKADIVFLQETYSSSEDENFWNTQWKGKMLFSHGSNHSKGTLVLIKQVCQDDIGGKNINWKKELKSNTLPHIPPFDPLEYALMLNSANVSVSEINTKKLYEAQVSDLREIPTAQSRFNEMLPDSDL